MSSASKTVSRLDGWWDWRAPQPEAEPAASPASEHSPQAGPQKPAAAPDDAQPTKATSTKTEAANPATSKPAPPEVRAQSLQLVWGPGEVAPGGKADHAELLRRLNLKPRGHLIEIGCGLGGFAGNASRDLGVQVTAADFDPMLVRLAQDLAGDAAAFQTASRAPFDIDASPANGIVARHAVGQAPPAQALQALADLLKPGGRLLLQEFCCAPDDNATRDALARNGVAVADPETIVAAAMGAGLTVSGLEDDTQALINQVVDAWTRLEPTLRSGELPAPVVAALEEEAAKWAGISAALSKQGARYLRIQIDAPPGETAPDAAAPAAEDKIGRTVARLKQIAGEAGRLVGNASRLLRRKRNPSRE